LLEEAIMSMKLTTEQLAMIGTKVEELDAIGVDVKVIHVEGHDVYLRKDGSGHLIVGITDKPKDHHEGNLR
jgi:hypothetical protein